MKRILFYFLIIVITFYLLKLLGRKEQASITPVKADTIYVPVPPKQVIATRKVPSRGLSTFLRTMGKIEGLGSYRTVSRSGYLGMYQFHPKTLRDLGFRVNRVEFLNNPELQDSAMVRYMRNNARELRHLINEFNGTYYNGIYITKSGILAGAHLVGTAGVYAYFYPERFNFRTVDGNGVGVEHYIKKFAGYDLRGI